MGCHLLPLWTSLDPRKKLSDAQTEAASAALLGKEATYIALLRSFKITRSVLTCITCIDNSGLLIMSYRLILSVLYIQCKYNCLIYYTLYIIHVTFYISHYFTLFYIIHYTL